MKNSLKISSQSKANETPKKEWKDYSKKEQRNILMILITVSIFILFWISSDFRSALAMVLLGYSLYFFVKAVRSRATWKKSIIVAIILLFTSIVIMPTTDADSDLQNTSVDTDTRLENEATELAEQERIAAAAKIEQESQRRVAAAQQITADGELYKVTSITDGDTIKVDINGAIETIRFIGIDTPETKDPGKPVKCFGKEASSKMQSLVQSKSVRLAADPSQDDRDKYGRLLRFVFLEDGRNVGYEMIKVGYAHEYTYDKVYQYHTQFKAAESAARDSLLGLWSAETCGGVTNQEFPPEPVAAPAPTPTYTPQPQVESTPSAYYTNCTAARNAGAAPVYAGQPGYGTHLDRDGDGVGCE